MSDAKQKLLDVSPQLLELVASDGSASQPVLRAQAFLLASELFGRRGTMSTAQQIQLMESYAKLGNLMPKAADGSSGGGSGFSINITLPGHAEKSITITQDAKADEAGSLSVLEALEKSEEDYASSIVEASSINVTGDTDEQAARNEERV